MECVIPIHCGTIILLYNKENSLLMVRRPLDVSESMGIRLYVHGIAIVLVPDPNVIKAYVCIS